MNGKVFISILMLLWPLFVRTQAVFADSIRALSQQQLMGYLQPAGQQTIDYREGQTFVFDNPLSWLPWTLAVAVASVVIIIAWRRFASHARAAADAQGPLIAAPPHEEEALADVPFKLRPQQQEMQMVPRRSQHKYFAAEIMVSAGPRKRPLNEPEADKDLGEDVCGLLMMPNEAVVWLLDGTSDFYVLRTPGDHREYFSSRLLAQSIGRCIRNYFIDPRPVALADAMHAIIEEVRLHWVDLVNRLPAGEVEVLSKNIAAGNCPECAATILVARLSITGALDVYRSGDCKALLYKENRSGSEYYPSPLEDKNPKSNDRIFFRMVAGDGGRLDIRRNEPLFEVVKEDEVQTVIGISDGVGVNTQFHLMKNFAADSEAARKDIIHQVQGTEDDKSIYILEIKPIH